MSRGFTPILIILLIALGVGGYIFIQKQYKPVSVSQPSPSPVVSDETSTWKTYTSSIYSFKYPSNWRELEKGKLSDDRVLNFVVDDEDVSFTVVSHKNPQRRSTFDWIRNPREGVYSDVELTDITVDNSKGVKFSTKSIGIESGDITYETAAALSRNDLIYTIAYRLPHPLQKEDVTLFDQILSTFRFN